MAKKRLDMALVERGLAETRAAAQRVVMAGLVFSNDRRLDKPGHSVADDMPLEVRGQPHPYVSRGGLKLEKALDYFGLSAQDRIALDVGASTGGFTDCLLQHGAAKVYAVDVGTNQLAWKLRRDPRVVSMERTNIRDITTVEVPEPVDFIVCDASFIGLRTALPAALALAKPGAHLVALIKPQFEVGKGRVGKGGIVRDPALHQEVCSAISDWLAAQPGWQVLGLTDSPIEGAEGNKEFLIAGRFRS
ncbi:MAG TPA: TlyA family RNA methyltransferase [Reyranella sp.]|nr:TlyA family RNA methyltransferase [Reyranella sp.]